MFHEKSRIFNKFRERHKFTKEIHYSEKFAKTYYADMNLQKRTLCRHTFAKNRLYTCKFAKLNAHKFVKIIQA